jgi:hypothetical protein
MIKENKIIRENLASEKGCLSYFEILTLIISIFAVAYIIGGVFKPVDAAAVEVAGLSCCEKTKNGAYCQYGLDSNCDPAFKKAPTECEYVDYCKKGCCYSQGTGTCSKATPKLLCDGEWTEDEFCNIPKCSRGCCVIGRQAIFTTEKSCAVKSRFAGTEKDFRPEVNTELECIFLAEKDEEGACVNGESCKIATKESCKKTGGNFYKGKYCSDPALGTQCLAHDSSKCFEQSVYWYDSCGNMEEIKEECSIFAGTTCALQGTQYKCKSIDCSVKIDGKTVTKKNGESWCEYEGTIGEGRDVPGSTHIRHVCFMGEERIEPCADYRNQICVQSDTDLGSGKIFSEAACRINNWRTCLQYNEEDKTKMQEKCNFNPDCYVKKVYVDEYFNFPFCSPQYPPGFDLSTESGGKSGESICSMGNNKCTVVYVKDLGGWDCVANCKCLEENDGGLFTREMNDLCTSLGDCGAYTNLEGQVTDDGYSVTRASKLSDAYLNDLAKFANTIPGQKAQPGNWTSLFGSGSTTPPDDAEDYNDYSDWTTGGGAIVGGALGVAGVATSVAWAGIGKSITGAPVIGDAVTGALKFFGVTPAAKSVTGMGALEYSATGGSPSAAATWNTVGATIGAAIGSYLAMKLFGDFLPPNAALVASIASSVLGSIVATQTATGSVFGSTSLAVGLAAFVWAFVIAVIIILVMKWIGVGDTKEKVVTFSCLPWQAPLGGSNCDKCKDNGICSEYECGSLGQRCEFINAGTAEENCVDVPPNDASSPKISPLDGVITLGYKYSNVKDVGFELTQTNGECIPEFTTVVFGIKTDRPAQCVVGNSPLETFDEMKGNYFGGSNLYSENHTSVLVIPSLESMKNEYNLTPIEISELGDFNLYVKCKGINEKANDAAYVIKSCVKEGPDLMEPYITAAAPPSGAHVAYNATTKPVTFYVNEPADCRWSHNSNDGYDKMSNQMTCDTSLENYGVYGLPCNATLDITAGTSFYVRCRDKSENQNTMTTSYAYELKQTTTPLRIVSISPANGTIIRVGSEPVTVNLEVLTADGAESGTAICYYKLLENGPDIRFFDTYSNTHKQVFSSVTGGKSKIWVDCEDYAGNTAGDLTEFTVYVDADGPVVTRVYYDAGLNIVTSEDSTCAYSLTDSKCGFDLNNITGKDNAYLMTGEGASHAADWQTEQTYYIKCMDEYGNQPGRCSIVVRPYEIIKK